MKKNMTLRDYAKSCGVEVVGKLKRVAKIRDEDQTNCDPLWIDEAGNEYIGNVRKGFCIVTTDGNVI